MAKFYGKFLGYLFLCVFMVSITAQGVFAVDWKSLAESLVKDFPGQIISIEKLTDKSCWAVLADETNESAALELASKIGEYIKSKIPDEATPKPMVRVFVKGKQVAIAVFVDKNYQSRKRFENMDPTMFKGIYRP